MPDADVLATLRAELHDELTARLLPYWMQHTLDERFGGFVGQIRQDGVVVAEAAKGSVLNARILWTFAAAYRVLGHASYRYVAERAYAYFTAHFWDEAHEGVFWTLDHRGRPLDARKQVYAQAFALYGLAEYHRATGAPDALARAIRLFRLLETRCADGRHGGYLEAFGRAWEARDDVRLSEKDLNVSKNMNTHLHVLEAYTNLYRAWPDPHLRERLAALVALFLAPFFDEETRHLIPFFDADWTVRSRLVSYGHDVEASWLLLEAAGVLGDPGLRARTREAALALACVTRSEGQDDDGGLFFEALPGHWSDLDKHWWPQAEAIVGFVNAYQETGTLDFLDAAVAAWAFTKRHLLDREGGEWFGRVSRAGIRYEDEDKVGLWKCPYHNARACLEVIERTATDRP